MLQHVVGCRNLRVVLLVLGIVVATSARLTYAISNFQTFDVPSSTGSFVHSIVGNSIGGAYYDATGQLHGFLYNGTGFATIDPPGSIPLGNPANHAGGSLVLGISGSSVVGSFYSGDSVDAGRHGYIFSNSTFTNIDDPSAVFSTSATGVSGNEVVGFYSDASRIFHGFTYDGTTFTNVDEPNALNASFSGTNVLGISGSTIFGYFDDTNFNDIGFIDNNGTFTQLSDPAATYGTQVTGVSGGTVVGVYYDANFDAHGFIYDGSTYTNVDDPFGADIYINAISGNTIGGDYLDSQGVSHGFIANVPEPASCISLIASVIPLVHRFRRAGATAKSAVDRR